MGYDCTDLGGFYVKEGMGFPIEITEEGMIVDGILGEMAQVGEKYTVKFPSEVTLGSYRGLDGRDRTLKMTGCEFTIRSPTEALTIDDWNSIGRVYSMEPHDKRLDGSCTRLEYYDTSQPAINTFLNLDLLAKCGVPFNANFRANRIKK